MGENSPILVTLFPGTLSKKQFTDFFLSGKQANWKYQRSQRRELERAMLLRIVCPFSLFGKYTIF
jgi:hypothetical protein